MRSFSSIVDFLYLAYYIFFVSQCLVSVKFSTNFTVVYLQLIFFLRTTVILEARCPPKSEAHLGILLPDQLIRQSNHHV